MAETCASQATSASDEEDQHDHIVSATNAFTAKHAKETEDNEWSGAESDDRVGEDGGSGNDNEEEGEDEEVENDEDDEDEEEKESTLKYGKLTSDIERVYKNGDLTSCVLTTGNKMIVGTHNGVVNIFQLPNFEFVRAYNTGGSITSISTSPFEPKFSAEKSESITRSNAGGLISPKKGTATNPSSPISPKSSPRQQPPVPTTPSNMIYIATSSINGHVCVANLVDMKDVILKKFGRPINAVALSPEYKSDRTYLSGGTAGELVLTVGGRAGVSQDANLTSTATGWLGSLVGSSSNKDQQLHSGEGTISAIKWSLSGKYVAWVNEHGIKIMRSHLHLESAESEMSWRRIGHISKPNRSIWEDMAGVWKARVEWINHKYLEENTTWENEIHSNGVTPKKLRPQSPSSHTSSSKEIMSETLLVGWGDTIWIIAVEPKMTNDPKRGQIPGSVHILHHIRFTDGYVSGCTLYKPSVLVALIYLKQEENNSKSKEDSLHRGISRRQNGLPTEIKFIDLNSPNKEELESEELKVNRYESLSMIDYHMTTLFVPTVRETQRNKRRTIETIGSGLWDASMNATTRLFSSNASILSRSDTSGDRQTIKNKSVSQNASNEFTPTILAPGLKIFINSPFDCILAVKKDRSDHLEWLLKKEDFEHAWALVDKHPEIIIIDSTADSRPGTPTPMAKGDQSLADFFADDNVTLASSTFNKNSHHFSEAEKQRIGELWINKLISSGSWKSAGAVAGKVLQDTKKWEFWLWEFIQAEKYDEISPHLPSLRLKPPLASEIYEVILGHYVSEDRPRLKEMLDQLDFDLFDIDVVTKAIETKLANDEVKEDSQEDGIVGRDWHILFESLARLYIANDQIGEAFRCYIKIKNVDAALSIVREYDSLDSLSKNIYDFILLRVSSEQLAHSETHMSELEQLTSEPIEFLLKTTTQGSIDPATVVNQLKIHFPAARPLLYFYFRALWLGGTSLKPSESIIPTASIRRSKFDANLNTTARSRTYLAPYGNLAVDLYADYSREVLADYLRNSRDYDFEHASAVCQEMNYVPELVHLLAATGQKIDALHLIIDELGDAKMAIDFAKDIDDEPVWDELLNYGIDKPQFIKGLLEEVGMGTAVNPATLVERIPPGLEVEGLKEGLSRLLRESEVTWSISDGAAKVLRSEIAARMDILQKGRSRGVMFEIASGKSAKVGLCAICHTSYTRPTAPLPTDLAATLENEHILGFPCGHIVHLTCLLDEVINSDNKTRIQRLSSQLSSLEQENPCTIYSVAKVGNKITAAQMIAQVIGKRACSICEKVT